MTIFNESVPANDDANVVDLLIAAHGICGDETTKHFIELALLHEARKISGLSVSSRQAEELNRTGTCVAR